MNNYFIHTILRFLSKEKVNVAICIIGFVISLITVFILTIYVNNELSYDRREGAEQIYRIVETSLYPGEPESQVPFVLYNTKEHIQDNIPELESITRIYPLYSTVNIKAGENYFSEQSVAYVDPEFFRVFSFPVITGNPTELNVPYSVVLTEKMAKKYFPDQSALGQQLLIDHIPYRICAVMEDFPPNSHFKFNILGSLSSFQATQLEQQGSSFYTYLKTNTKTDLQATSKKINSLLVDIYKKHDQDLGIEREISFKLQPLTDIHLYSHLPRELEDNGNIIYIKISILLGFFILLISAINFANITTALSERKIRFFSINKVVGATNREINKLLYLEIAIMILISFLIAAIIACIIGKWCLMNLLGIEIIYNKSILLELFIAFAMISFILFLIAVLFSAVSFSRISLRSGFSGVNHSGKRWSFTLYKTLLCIQMIVTITLIGCLYKSHNQLEYLRSKDLGFDKNNVLVFTDLSWNMQQKIPLLKTELLKLPFIEKVTISGELPGTRTPQGNCRLKENDNNKTIDCCLLRVDRDYISVLGIPLAEGYFFDSPEGEIQNSIVINETAAKSLTNSDVIGKFIEFWDTEYKIIGIIKDFHVSSLHDVISPVLLIQDHSAYCDIAIRSRNLSAGNLHIIKNIFKHNLPDYVPNYYALSEKFNSMYKAEERISHMNWGLMIVSTIIAFMGIWSFASLFIGKKWKEMGVRKTFGANTPDLIYILLKNFIQVTLISFILSIPLIYQFAEYLDRQFAYNSGISLNMFIISLGSVAFIIAITISYHCYQIVKLNAVSVLKHD